MTYQILKYVFFGLLCLPILFIGGYFCFKLIYDYYRIKLSDQKRAKQKREDKEKALLESDRRKRFHDDFDKNKYGY